MTVVRSPKSGVNFFSLGDFEEQLEMACERAQPAIYQVRRLCIRPTCTPVRGCARAVSCGEVVVCALCALWRCL